MTRQMVTCPHCGYEVVTKKHDKCQCTKCGRAIRLSGYRDHRFLDSRD